MLYLDYLRLDHNVSIQLLQSKIATNIYLYMQSSRLTIKLPQLSKITKYQTIVNPNTRTMSTFFPTHEFAPLFRLLDDYDVHRSTKSSNNLPTSSIRAFRPKFDVREDEDLYKLEGELPGIDQKDVQIEFTDPHTLIIKGKVVREASSSNVTGVENGHETGRITERDSSPSSYHQATVEDEDASSHNSAVVANTPSISTQVTKSTKSETAKGHKYWLTERSVGEFHRSFSFPSRVDQDAVKASLKNGILGVVVPKMVAPVSRKITID